MLKRCSLIALIAAIITFGFATRSQADVGNWIASSATCVTFARSGNIYISGGPEDAMASLSFTQYAANGSVAKSGVYNGSLDRNFITGYIMGGGVKVVDNNNGGKAFTCGNVPASAAAEVGSTGFSGPAIPKNTDGSVYEQKYIACTMSVFDAPGGNAVNSASVKEGQVFYAGKDVADADGKSWTPIFVSSGTPVWILTSCVK